MHHTMAAPVTPPDSARDAFAKFDKKAKDEAARKTIDGNGMHIT